MRQSEHLIYEEKVTSDQTEALFMTLMALFLLVGIWRMRISKLDVITAVCFCLFVVFLFYSVNYRTLVIRVTEDSLRLVFGVIAWKAPFKNIEECRLDNDIPVLMRYGGAGVHFMLIHRRYRASFNLLEHPRVVIMLKRKAGLVRDISFSTCRPDELITLVQGAISNQGKPPTNQ